MGNVVTTQERPRSVLMDMATRYGMEPANFAATLKATVVPADVSNEQFAAFLLVAKEYGLNPLTKEIYAFPARKGGIQPIVSIDGWVRIVNNHPQLDGITFDDIIEDGKLVAITCNIYRKDRTKPIAVTEYLEECKQPTEPWKKWPIRMLRHKALIQCARYAFGFSGIVDPDEAERMKDVTPTRSNDGLTKAILDKGNATPSPDTPKTKLDELLESNSLMGEVIQPSTPSLQKLHFTLPDGEVLEVDEEEPISAFHVIYNIPETQQAEFVRANVEPLKSFAKMIEDKPSAHSQLQKIINAGV